MLDHIALKGISIKVNVKNWLNRSKQNHLWDVRNKSLGTYSGGMKQRFELFKH
jgi:ABC-type multidrug transport system ATPase subunit